MLRSPLRPATGHQTSITTIIFHHSRQPHTQHGVGVLTQHTPYAAAAAASLQHLAAGSLVH
eukprot:scaffold4410_cov127-Skeletonema_marinoi.AAC.9